MMLKWLGYQRFSHESYKIDIWGRKKSSPKVWTLFTGPFWRKYRLVVSWAQEIRHHSSFRGVQNILWPFSHFLGVLHYVFFLCSESMLT